MSVLDLTDFLEASRPFVTLAPSEGSTDMILHIII